LDYYNGPKRRVSKLIKILKNRLKTSEDLKQVRMDYDKFASLLYSTESHAGYLRAYRMLNDDTKKRSRIVDNATFGLLDLRPHIIAFEKTFKDVNYFEAGFCHHADRFWYEERMFSQFIGSSFPLEASWKNEIVALNKMKKKMKQDCRLSFLNVTYPPKPIDKDSIWDGSGKRKLSGKLYLKFLVLVSDVPYLRNLTGRYFVDRFSVAIQRDADKHFSSN
jgi:hypothetical protein